MFSLLRPVLCCFCVGKTVRFFLFRDLPEPPRMVTTLAEAPARRPGGATVSVFFFGPSQKEKKKIPRWFPSIHLEKISKKSLKLGIMKPTETPSLGAVKIQKTLETTT